MKRPARTVPLLVWGAAGALFLAVLLFAHWLPDAKTAEATGYFNVQRLDRLRARQQPGVPRVVVVGTSLSMSALFFDEDMEQFARDNGLPGVQFIRFTKLDASLEDYAPLLAKILDAAPDIVLFESRLFLLTHQFKEWEKKTMRFFAQEDGKDARKKLKRFFEERFGAKRPQQKKENPNVAVSEKKILDSIRRRQTQNDLDNFQNAMEDKMIVREFSVPAAYAAFFEELRKRGIIGALLDTPASEHETTLFAHEKMLELTRHYQEACAIHALAYPGKLGLEYYKDFRHMNERGRDAFSRWFLAEIPLVMKKGRPS